MSFEELARVFPRLLRLESELIEASKSPEAIRRSWAEAIYGEAERHFLLTPASRELVFQRWHVILPRKVEPPKKNRKRKPRVRTPTSGSFRGDSV